MNGDEPRSSTSVFLLPPPSGQGQGQGQGYYRGHALVRSSLATTEPWSQPRRPLPVCTSPWLPARMLKVYPVGRGRAGSWQVCPAPTPHLPALALPASLAWHCQGPMALMYCLLIPGEGRGKGRGQVILVQPAVSRWPTTVAGRGHQGRGESLNNHSTKCQDTAVSLPAHLRAPVGEADTDSLSLGDAAREMHQVPNLNTGLT